VSRETLDDKARRVLAEGRLRVRLVADDGYVIAEVRGLSGAVYTCGYLPAEQRAGCTCKASREFGRECYHLRALWLVVPRPDIKRLRRTA
jgi:hypothetical protein